MKNYDKEASTLRKTPQTRIKDKNGFFHPSHQDQRPPPTRPPSLDLDTFMHLNSPKSAHRLHKQYMTCNVRVMTTANTNAQLSTRREKYLTPQCGQISSRKIHQIRGQPTLKALSKFGPRHPTDSGISLILPNFDSVLNKSTVKPEQENQQIHLNLDPFPEIFIQESDRTLQLKEQLNSLTSHPFQSSFKLSREATPTPTNPGPKARIKRTATRSKSQKITFQAPARKIAKNSAGNKIPSFFFFQTKDVISGDRERFELSSPHHLTSKYHLNDKGTHTSDLRFPGTSEIDFENISCESVESFRFSYNNRKKSISVIGEKSKF